MPDTVWADLPKVLRTFGQFMTKARRMAAEFQGHVDAAAARPENSLTVWGDQGDLEILSLAGTLSPDGAHLHIAIADASGAVLGGHLCNGSRVRTTAELVLGLLPDWQFSREHDTSTGYAELQISPHNG